MAFSEENEKWIRDQIQQAVYPNGFKKIAGRLRYWGLLAVLVTAFLALIAIVVTLGIALFNKANEESRFRGSAEQRLTRIESDIKEIKDQQTKQSLATHAALSPSELKATLPELHASLKSAQQNNLRVSDTVLAELSNKLAAIKSPEPAYWPAAATLISYRSYVLIGTPQGWQSFPPCAGMADLDSSPNASAQVRNPDGTLGPKVPIQRIGVQDCTIQLDGKTGSRWDCKHCVVKYSGGAVSLHDVRFEDCLFIFEIPQNQIPAPSGQDFTQQVLASDFRNVEIKST